MSFDVEKVARLAHLELTENEKKVFGSQFANILKYVDQLQEIPMSADEAKNMGAFHVQTAFYDLLKLNMDDKLRDEEHMSEEDLKLKLSNDEALSNAPKSGGLPGQLMYEVPSIIERS